MTINDKALIICAIGVAFGLVLIAIDIQRTAYAKGLRDGWHRGRSMNRQEFWEE